MPVILDGTASFKWVDKYYSNRALYQLAPGYWKIYDGEEKEYITIKQTVRDSLKLYEISVPPGKLPRIRTGLYVEDPEPDKSMDDPFAKNIRGIAVSPPAYDYSYGYIYTQFLKQKYRSADNIDDWEAYINHQSYSFEKLLYDTCQPTGSGYDARFMVYKCPETEWEGTQNHEDENEIEQHGLYHIQILGQYQKNEDIKKVLLEKTITLPQGIELKHFSVEYPDSGSCTLAIHPGYTFKDIEECIGRTYGALHFIFSGNEDEIEMYYDNVMYQYGTTWILTKLVYNGKNVDLPSYLIDIKESPEITPYSMGLWN